MNSRRIDDTLLSSSPLFINRKKSIYYIENKSINEEDLFNGFKYVLF